jgi:hypothetical protein
MTDYTADYTARILSHYDAASPDDVAAGLAWYGRAESAMRAMARRHGVSRQTAAGVTAALSPQTPWSTKTGRTPNIDAADRVLSAAREGRPMPAVNTGDNRRKAWAIANGADPDAVLSGPKVTAFYANLTGDPDRPTVDLWAARAAGVDPERLTDKRRRELRDAYRIAAESRGVAVRDMQAAVWVAVRGAA